MDKERDGFPVVGGGDKIGEQHKTGTCVTGGETDLFEHEEVKVLVEVVELLGDNETKRE